MQRTLLPFERFFNHMCFSNRLCSLCLNFRCRFEQNYLPECFTSIVMFNIFVCVCASACVFMFIVCNMCAVVFYLHSKDLIKVSRLTQQLMVNLASFSFSPTHDLSIFLLYQNISRHVTALNRCAII